MSGERPAFPTNADVIRSLIDQHAGGTFVALPGVIQRYDDATQRADVVVGVRNPYPDPQGSGELLREDFPVIPHVKVLFPRMGPWFVAMSARPGDAVQLLVNTLTIEDWLAGDGNVVDVGDTRRQHLAHCVALVGLEVDAKALRHAPPAVASEGAPEGCLTVGHDADDGLRLSLYRDGRAKLTRGDASCFEVDAEGTVHAGGAPAETRPLALAPLVAAMAQSLKDHIAAWLPVPQDGGASLKLHMAAWSPPDVGAQKAKGV